MTCLYYLRLRRSPLHSRPLCLFTLGVLCAFASLHALAWLRGDDSTIPAATCHTNHLRRFVTKFSVSRFYSHNDVTNSDEYMEKSAKNKAFTRISGDYEASREGNINHLLLLGVMTAARYADGRAYNVWSTWARGIPGRIFFFVAENTTISRQMHASAMPLISLPGVDDTYPPQKKSFSMLRWMYDNYLEEFDWFMRADDDLYVRNEKLAEFLRSLDPNKAHMLGQAGLGRSNEYGQLAFGARDNYCMGGPGVIFSREALRQLGPHLETCLRDVVTGHEDVEVGRCVRKYVGITCTWNYEMRTLFRNNQTDGWSPNATVSGEFRRALTLHPIKNPDLMLKVHIHAQSLQLAELRTTRVTLTREFRSIAQPTAAISIPPAFGAPLRLTRRIISSLADITRWEYVSLNKLLFCAERANCPRHTLNVNTRAAINQIVVQLFDKFNSNARQRGRLLQFQNVQYGYMRVEPRYGVDYVLDIALWFKKLRPIRSMPVRRHAYIQQTFGPLEALTDAEFRAIHRTTSSDKASTTLLHAKNAATTSDGHIPSSINNEHGKGSTTDILYIIMALRGRADTFQRFARNLRSILPSEERNLKLIIVLYRTQNITENVRIAETIGELSRVVHIRVVDMHDEGDEAFSRGRALTVGASSVPNDALLFFTDVDMLFDYTTIQRVRLNTILGIQVYFPIIFSEYAEKYWLTNEENTEQNNNDDGKSTLNNDSELPHFVRSDRGYFRSFGFGIVSIYARDFSRVGRFNITIRGWGMEDVDFFERCIRFRLRVFRAPDPSLIHVAHSIRCERETMPDAQWRMCVGTKTATLASQRFLTRLLAPSLLAAREKHP